MASKFVKMCDMPIEVATRVLEMLNPGKVRGGCSPLGMERIILTDVEPKDLTYPEGWYYAKGSFRNKHMSTNGKYQETPMLKNSGKAWGDCAFYCTLHDED